ncbi:MAG: hypothetical protein HY852_08620 [Bradyrhizobium sp.]|uniref:hypothetical protein n=1 Tax=Bradyrhizobium sp. TaxID=376 RepID=UPI0025C60D53|nr:hypothetical protein [Bradyrhizobium sp.]MBI5261861.1 hypothetical protein [Bradyrhizobium sp.]
MSISAPEFLVSLQSAAQRADSAEAELQREIIERRKAIEQARKFAYRRYNFVKAIVDSVSGAGTREAAVAHALAAMRNSLGWSGDSEARQATLTDFVPVAEAVFATVSPAETEPPEVDVLAVLAEFEARYQDRHGTPFWSLFENYFPETPVVDF